MTTWTIDLKPRPEPRSPGARVAVIGTIVFLACLGLGSSLGSLLLR